jgi:ribosomal protein S18 acetylase RimI-like enzyme
MTPEFHVEENPSSVLLGEAGALAPTNPFFTQAFVQSMAALGYRPWLMSLRNGSRLLAAGLGLMKSGRLNRSLEFTSLPIPEASDLFWEKTLCFCRDLRVSYLEVNSFASAEHRIPLLPGEIERRGRTEYVIDLKKPTLWTGLSSNHKRNVKLAQKAGLQLTSRSDAQACRDHLRLVQSSLDRRKARGETVDNRGEAETFMTYARNGLAEWFQAVKAGEVLSSILVLKAERGGYYQSAGTTSEGMAQGASSFLICETATALRDRGMDVFNLGGADEHNPGLQRFKAGFGAASVELQATRLYLGSALKRRLTTAAALLRHDPRAFVRQLAGRWETYVAYVAVPSDIPLPDPLEGVSVQELSRESAAALPLEHADVRRQMERFDALDFKGAYVVRRGSRVAHLAALVMPEQDRRLPVRHVRLGSREAEITHCLTLPDFRGQGMYPFAIRTLCRIACERGVHRVFMIAAVDNDASQRGIEKAGFTRRGTIVRVVLPYWPGGKSLTFRGHRWALSRRGPVARQRT